MYSNNVSQISYTLVVLLIRSPLSLPNSMTQGHQVQILGIFSFNLYRSWYSTRNIWLLLRAMKQQSKGCQKLCCRHLIRDPGSQWPTFFCDRVGVLALVLPSMGNHHLRQWVSRWMVIIFFFFLIFIYI